MPIFKQICNYDILLHLNKWSINDILAEYDINMSVYNIILTDLLFGISFVTY